MSRHRNLKEDIKDIYDNDEDDYDDYLDEKYDSQDENEDINYIWEQTGMKVDLEEIRKLLHKFDYNVDQTIEHILKYMDKILNTLTLKRHQSEQSPKIEPKIEPVKLTKQISHEQAQATTQQQIKKSGVLSQIQQEQPTPASSKSGSVKNYSFKSPTALPQAQPQIMRKISKDVLDELEKDKFDGFDSAPPLQLEKHNSQQNQKAMHNANSQIQLAQAYAPNNVPHFQSQQQILQLASQQKIAQPKQEKGINLNVNAKHIVDVSIANMTYPEIQYKNQCKKDEKRNINIVIVGHVDSGKSTLAGKLLYLSHLVDQNTMHKYQKESKEQHKESFQYAWVMDLSSEERKRGVTIHGSQKSFQTEKHLITILDTPGHKDFIPNMIKGSAQADAAIIVIDASINAFEGGFEFGGQTREHTILVRSLGCSQVIVAVNKMDNVHWDANRFKEIGLKLKNFLIEIGFDKNSITFVPISAFSGQNLLEKCPLKEAEWYTKGFLIEVIDRLHVPQRDNKKPVRLTISDVQTNNEGKLKGIVVQGKIEGGLLEHHEKYIIMPARIVVQLKDMFFYDDGVTGGQKIDCAEAGDNIEASIHLDHLTESVLLRNGDVLCSLQYPIPVSKLIEVEIVTYHIEQPITRGGQFWVHINCQMSSAIVKRLIKKIDKNNGESIDQKTPKFIKSNECAVLEIELKDPMCCELHVNYKSYGRIVLRSHQTTVAIGMIIKIK